MKTWGIIVIKVAMKVDITLDKIVTFTGQEVIF